MASEGPAEVATLSGHQEKALLKVLLWQSECIAEGTAVVTDRRPPCLSRYDEYQ